MSDYLPRDLLVDIFERLPIKQLKRCMLVCKSWYSLITSPGFISMNLNRVHKTQILSGHKKVEGYDERECYVSKHVFELYHVFYRACEIVGNVNGLICLCMDFFPCDPILTLWNPAIHKLLRLPKPNVTFSSTGRAYSHSFGFGFDHVSSDFKLVRVVHFKKKLVPPVMRDDDHDIKEKLVPPVIEIYRLSTGKWEAMSHVNLPYRFEGRSFYACLNGNLHWVGYGKKKKKDAIVLFNLSSEQFQLMKLPDHLCSQGKTKKVDVFQGSLALIDFFGDSSNLCIWIMGRYGDEHSWTRIYRRNLCHAVEVSPAYGVDYNALITNYHISVSVDGEKDQMMMLQEPFTVNLHKHIIPSMCSSCLHKALPTIRAQIHFSCSGSRPVEQTIYYLGAYFESLALIDKGVRVCTWDIPREDVPKKALERVASYCKSLQCEAKKSVNLSSYISYLIQNSGRVV